MGRDRGGRRYPVDPIGGCVDWDGILKRVFGPVRLQSQHPYDREGAVTLLPELMLLGLE